MKIKSKLANKILNVFLAFIALILTLVIVLIYGISIDKFDIFNVSINNLNLKLEKKLTLSIDEVYIKKANNENSTNTKNIKDIINNIKRYKKFLLLFNKIDIKNINIEKNNYNFFYDRKTMQINTNNLHVIMDFDNSSDILTINIKKVQYKEIIFTGKIISSKKTVIEGVINTLNNDFSSNLAIEHTKDNTTINLNDIVINNKNAALENIKDYLPHIMQEWLISRVQFDNFNGNLKIYIKDNKLNGIFGDGVFKNVNATYNDKAPIIYADTLNIIFKERSMLLKGENLYGKNNIKLDNFKLYIKDILIPDVLLELSAKNILYSKEIEQILNAYKIQLGLEQINGSSNAKIQILLNHDHSHNLQADINSSGEYKYKNFNFKASDINVNINNKLINIKGNINTNEIKAKNISVNMDINTKIANINIDKLNINFNDYFKYDDSMKIIFNLNNKLLQITNLDINIPLQDDVKIKTKLDKILPYSAKLQEYNFQNGDIELISKNGIYFINILNSNFDFGIYKNKNFEDIKEANEYIKISENKYNKDDFYIKITPESVNVTTKSSNINANINKGNSQININNILIPVGKNDNSSKSDINLTLNNSQILYNNFMFNFTKLKINKENENIKIKGELGNNETIITTINNSIFKTYIRNLQGTSLNKIISKKIFHNGTLDMDLEGKDFNNFSGLININNASLAHTKNYVNLLAIIDSIPSLITINKPNFTKTGLGIKLGSIEFTKQNNIIDISNINIKGYSIDINGKGSIDLNKNYANIITNIFTLKGTNKIISNIPIVKEVIIGDKNNKIATQLKIHGNLDDLKFQTSIAKDIITSPFSLMKNIITLPKNLLDF